MIQEPRVHPSGPCTDDATGMHQPQAGLASSPKREDAAPISHGVAPPPSLSRADSLRQSSAESQLPPLTFMHLTAVSDLVQHLASLDFNGNLS